MKNKKLEKVKINVLSGTSILVHGGSEVSLNPELWKVEKTVDGVFIIPKKG